MVLNTCKIKKLAIIVEDEQNIVGKDQTTDLEQQKNSTILNKIQFSLFLLKSYFTVCMILLLTYYSPPPLLSKENVSLTFDEQHSLVLQGYLWLAEW